MHDCVPDNLRGQDHTHCVHSMFKHMFEQTSTVVSNAPASTARDNRLHLEACQDCPQPAVAVWDAGSPVDLLGQPGQQQLGGRRAVAHDAVQGTPPLGQVVL